MKSRNIEKSSRKVLTAEEREILRRAGVIMQSLRKDALTPERRIEIAKQAAAASVAVRRANAVARKAAKEKSQ